MAWADGARTNGRTAPQREQLKGAFFWLSAFYLIYCVRPEDWIPGLVYIPLAKITAVCALIALLVSFGKTKRGIRDLPREAIYLSLMIGLLFISALLSPIWRGGAFFRTLDFSKVLVAWALTFLLVTDFSRLRRIIFIQSGSVPIICLVSILKGHDRPRLQGVLGGIYSDPNDLAFAIVLSLPLCLALCLNSRGALRKAIWGVLILIMGAALMLTASRAGFIDLVISMTVCLWHFGIRGRRLSLVVGTVVIGAALLLGAGGRLKDRFLAMTGTGIGTKLEISASGSFEERRFLMIRSLVGIMHYPIFGVGVRNFAEYSGIWKVVHASYLQIGVEGGIPVMVLYLMFFWRGFANLRMTKRIGIPDREISLFYGALHSSLVGFVVGACFAPEAYQFFPYFTVAYTSVFLLIIKERKDSSAAPVKAVRRFRHFTEVDATDEPPAVLPSMRS